MIYKKTVHTLGGPEFLTDEPGMIFVCRQHHIEYWVPVTGRGGGCPKCRAETLRLQAIRRACLKSLQQKALQENARRETANAPQQSAEETELRGAFLLPAVALSLLVWLLIWQYAPLVWRCIAPFWHL